MLQERTYKQKELGYDNEYYRYIFKKTEKIVCAVFYILQNQPLAEDKSVIVKDIEAVSLRTLDTALQTLSGPSKTQTALLHTLRYALMELESKLRVLNAMYGITDEQLHVFVSEIDSVGRTLEHYVHFNQSANPLERDEAASEQERRATNSGIFQGSNQQSSLRSRSGRSPESDASAESGADRRIRILEVLRSTGEAVIKDISAVITDCSEKTIQRELNALIKDGLVKRKGQRRWSRYSAVTETE